jgi:hypothetical protein
MRTELTSVFYDDDDDDDDEILGSTTHDVPLSPK